MTVVDAQAALPVITATIPTELRELPAWAVWRHEADDRGHISKPPYQPNGGGRAHASDPATWASFGEAMAVYGRGGWDGVSFAISELHDIVGVDLDHVEEHLHDAAEITRVLASYTEVSPSGEGLRVFVRGSLPVGRRIRDWVEMYSAKRFLTVTGHRVIDFPPTIMANQGGLEYVHGLWLEQAWR